ncbi:MAG: mechanosensitive ion channel family protein [Planctomycetota bacterium]|nr:mechanosensitive ion channel family protein [Planctomycetota bacterium]
MSHPWIFSLAQDASTNAASPASAAGGTVQQLTEWYGRNADVIALWAGRLGWALLILVVAWWLSGAARRAVRKAVTRSNLDPTLGKFFSNIARWGILAIGVVTALGKMGLETATFATVIGAVGLAIALGFQGTLGNLAAGVVLLVFRPFKVGDVITVGGVSGTVNEIDLFSTELDTADGRRIIVPNAQIASSTVENVTHHVRRKAEVRVAVPRAVAAEKVHQALLAAAAGVKKRELSSPPDVALVDYTDATTRWSVGVWTTRDDLAVVRNELAVVSHDAVRSLEP